MKNRIVVSFVVVLSAIGLFFSPNQQKVESSDLINSKCAISSFQKAFDESEAVFVGEVLSEKKDGNTKTFDFKVEKYWKGADSKKIKIDVYETARYQAWFKVGKSYLVYASKDEDGNLRVSRCSRSKDVEFAEEDLQKLGTGKKPRE